MNDQVEDKTEEKTEEPTATPEAATAAKKPAKAKPAAEKKPAPGPAANEESLYDQLGGQGSVDAAVDIFYRKVVGDARINYFFFGVNVAEQAKKQKAFLTMAFGGPHNYTGQDMRRGHSKLVDMGLSDRHFDIVLDHLRDTLAELDVAEKLIDDVIAIAESTRNDVLGR